MDPYSILNISINASKIEIKKAYKTLSQRYHPDKITGDANKFIEIKEAYNWLIENFNIHKKEEVIYKSSFSREEAKPQAKYKKEEHKKEPNIYSSNVNGFMGFEASGLIIYKLPLDELLKGGEIIFNVPNYKPIKIILMPGTRPGTIINAKAEGGTNWFQGFKNINIRLLLGESFGYTIDELNLIRTEKLSFENIVNRKSFMIPHPAQRNYFSNSNSLIEVKLPTFLLSNAPIIIPGYGFIDSKIGNILVFLQFEIPNKNGSI